MQLADYPTVPPDFGNWLAGFIDGEGCFSMNRLRRKGVDYRSYACRFAIRLRHDDVPVLEEIQRRTGCGKINELRPTSPTIWWDSKPYATWQVFSKRDCLRMIEILDKYPLRAKKARDYLVWREAALLWASVRQTGSHSERNQSIWDQMEALKEQLTAVRAYVAPGEVGEVDPVPGAEDLVNGEGVAPAQMSLVPFGEAE